MSTGEKNTNSKSGKKNIRFEHDLVEQIEKAKDPLIPFAAWVKQACREKLNSGKVHVGTGASGYVRPVVQNKAKPRYIWTTPQGEFDNRTDAVKASGVKADSLTKKCDDPNNTEYSRVLANPVKA